MQQGQLAHFAGPTKDGWCVVDVWDSEEAASTFFQDTFQHAVTGTGFPSAALPTVFPVEAWARYVPPAPKPKRRWELHTRRCGPCGFHRRFGLVSITKFDVEHRKVSDGSWTAVPASGPYSGTYDGNEVRLVATLKNISASSETAKVSFYADGIFLGAFNQSLLAGQSFPATTTWYTDGWSWNADGTPHTDVRLISVRVELGQNLLDTSSYSLKIRPKPVFIVHGYHENAGTFSSYVGANGFLQSVRQDWQGSAVQGMNMDSSSTALAIPDNARILATAIKAVRENQNAWHVDMVSHSMGGLVSRQYIQSFMPGTNDGQPVVSHLVMLGTPNRGSFCTVLRGWVYIGSSFGALGGTIGVPDYELATSYVEGTFNANVNDKKSVEFDNLVGSGLLGCYRDSRGGDLAVRYASATAFADRLFERVGRLHTDMPSSFDDFRDFVKPCLAVSRSGRTNCGNTAAGAVVTAAATGDPQPQVIHAEEIPLGANAAATISIPVVSGISLGVMVDAPAAVDAELLDPSGASVDHDVANGDRAQGPFRILSAASPVAGTWQVRLRNTEAVARVVDVSAWVDGSPLALAVTTGQPGQDGRGQIDATLANGGAPALGAAIQAHLTAVATGATVDITLQPLGNGTYRGTTAPLPSGAYTVAALATYGGEQRGVATAVKVALTTGTPTYAVAASASGDGSVAASPNPGPYAAGSVVTLTATPGAGSTFVGWTLDGAAAGKTITLTITMDRDHTVVAAFAPAASPSPTPSPSPSSSPSASPVPAVALTLNQAAGGTIAAAPPGPYRVGEAVTLVATPDPGRLFLGWQVAGSQVVRQQSAVPVDSWANPLTLTLTQATAITPVFGARPAFGDVPAGDPAAVAIANLAARGVINGCDSAATPPLFCPGDIANREQMAALLVRAIPGWADEDGQPTFADNTADAELMRRVATVQRHGVAQGYQDEVCLAQGKASPCFGPLDDVRAGQVILFIARAMVAKGYWTLQPDDPALFPELVGGTDREVADHRALVTYVRYAGAPPGVDIAPGQPFATWGDPAARDWFARALWQALDATFGR